MCVGFRILSMVTQRYIYLWHDIRHRLAYFVRFWRLRLNDEFYKCTLYTSGNNYVNIK